MGGGRWKMEVPDLREDAREGERQGMKKFSLSLPSCARQQERRKGEIRRKEKENKRRVSHERETSPPHDQRQPSKLKEIPRHQQQGIKDFLLLPSTATRRKEDHEEGDHA